MRGQLDPQSSMFHYFSPESCVPADHPLRQVKKLADRALAAICADLDALYSQVGRPSIEPERLLKGQLLIALYSVRSDRQFCEQLDYNILFRWFLDMDLESAGLDQSNFSRLRERLVTTDIARRFFDEVVCLARREKLLSSDHFTIDGTLIEAWASFKSFKRKDGEPPKDGSDGTGMADFKGEKRSNATHESTTDPESRLMRKGNGQPAKLSYGGHVLMENRHGLCVDILITESTQAEHRAARQLLTRGRRRHIIRRRLALTRAITSRNSSRTCASIKSVRISLELTIGARRDSMAERPGPRGIRSVSASENASRKSSAGSKRSAGCARRDSSARRKHRWRPSFPARPITC